jgi:hypothetical protein
MYMHRIEQIQFNIATDLIWKQKTTINVVNFQTI